MVEALYLMATAATEYLVCSREEFLACVQPDLFTKDGARLWLRRTLDDARPVIKTELDRRKILLSEAAAREETAKARRKGMKKAGALLTGKVCEALDCSKTELDRWATDGRLPPDGEIMLVGLPKKVNARAWLPGTVEAAKVRVEAWREQDRARKVFKRRGLRPVD